MPLPRVPSNNPWHSLTPVFVFKDGILSRLVLSTFHEYYLLCIGCTLWRCRWLVTGHECETFVYPDLYRSENVIMCSMGNRRTIKSKFFVWSIVECIKMEVVCFLFFAIADRDQSVSICFNLLRSVSRNASIPVRESIE